MPILNQDSYHELVKFSVTSYFLALAVLNTATHANTQEETEGDGAR
jgi:hypothetical protein